MYERQEPMAKQPSVDFKDILTKIHELLSVLPVEEHGRAFLEVKAMTSERFNKTIEARQTDSQSHAAKAKEYEEFSKTYLK